MKHLLLNNENIDVCLPPYLRINMTIWLKRQIPDLAYHVNNTYAKLAPGSILNKNIKEIMRYARDTVHPLSKCDCSHTCVPMVPSKGVLLLW